MFTTGRIAFMIFFLFLFVSTLIWAYRKDIRKSPWYFKGSYKILLAIFIIYFTYFLLTRILM